MQLVVNDNADDIIFELRMYGIGSDRSINYATTTAQPAQRLSQLFSIPKMLKQRLQFAASTFLASLVHLDGFQVN